MKEIVNRLTENRQIELAKSILESNGYKVSKKISLSQLLKGYDYELKFQFSHDDGKGMLLKNPVSELPELIDFLISNKGCEDLGNDYLRAPDNTLLRVVNDSGQINIRKYNTLSTDALDFNRRHTSYNLSKSFLQSYASNKDMLDFIESNFDIDYIGSLNHSGESSSSIHLKNSKNEVIDKLESAGYIKSENPRSHKYSNGKDSITLIGGDSQSTVIKVG